MRRCGRALIVPPIDRPGQIDEFGIERLTGLLVPDSVFDIPERLIDLDEMPLEQRQTGVAGDPRLRPGVEQRQFQPDVGQRRLGLQAGLLDLQYGDLVDQKVKKTALLKIDKLAKEKRQIKK